MDSQTVLTILSGLGLAFGFYMAWNIGANDVANAMGTSMGSGALTLRRAVLVAAVLEFAGAYLVGMHVTETMRSGIVDVGIFDNDPLSFILGMLAALLAAGAWLQVASYFGWPVSTTHSIVGALVGFGAVHGGLQAVHWSKLGSIVSSWVISPVLAGIISFIIFRLLLRTIFYSNNPVRAAQRATPVLVFFVFVILSFVMIFKGLKNLGLDKMPFEQALLWAGGVALVAAAIAFVLVRRIDPNQPPGVEPAPFHERSVDRSLRKARKHLIRVRDSVPADQRGQVETLLGSVDQLTYTIPHSDQQTPTPVGEVGHYATVERIFVYLQILSACFVAFAHGANDVANAIGPMAAVLETARHGVVAVKADVPAWVLALGGAGIVVGLATWGWRVIETVGKRITELTPTRGFAAEFGAATTIVVASKLGLPISTTHTLVGAVLGVGLARGLGALNLNTLRDIVISWLVTLPAGAGLAIVFFYGLKLIFA